MQLAGKNISGIFLGVKNTFLFTKECSYALMSLSSGKSQAHGKMFQKVLLLPVEITYQEILCR